MRVPPPALTPTTRIGVVLALVYKPGSGFLLLKRSKAKGGFWSFPGGRVEPDECEYGALVREVAEETAVMCRPVARLGQRVHRFDQRPIAYWLCDWRAGAARNCEPEHADEVGFFAAAAIIDRCPDLFPPARAALLRLD